MLRSMVTLARWLGPWASPSRAPRVDVQEERVDELRVRLYRARSPFAPQRAPFLIAPGLHYAGPDDPRLDRFCRILAAAGHLVIAPYIPSYLALVPDRTALADFERIFAARTRWTTARPVLFSISFGSLLAFALAAAHPDDIDGVISFGGYADFRSTMQFCLTGAARDPLNQPVVLMNLLPHLDPPCPDPGTLVPHWRRYIESTWGRPEMKAPARYTAIAHLIAARVPAPLRDLFHIGVGTQPGAHELAHAALARFDGAMLDPAPHLARIRGRVDLVHGVDDDVIPHTHAHEIARQLVNADVRVHVTGLYGHTGAQTPRPADLARELATMLRVVRTFAR